MYGVSKVSRWVRAGALALAATSMLSFSQPADGSGGGGAKGNFEGVWQVRVTPDSSAADAGKQEFVDLVLFEDSKLTASACAAYGFAPADVIIDGASFSCTMTSEQGTIVWSGGMHGGLVSGAVDWTRPDGNVDHYTLTGARYTPPPEQQQSEE